MSAPRGVASAVLETLEFPAALERVADHAAGPLGAARVRSRRPVADGDAIRAALAQVAELAALLLRDDDMRAGPVPDIDRKSTRLNSSHTVSAYAVVCLKKKTS